MDEEGAEAVAARDPQLSGGLRSARREGRRAVQGRQAARRAAEDLADPVQRLKKIDEAMASLEEEAKQEAKEEGRGSCRPPARAQRNFADPDSRTMKSMTRPSSIHPGLRRPRRPSTRSTRWSWWRI